MSSGWGTAALGGYELDGHVYLVGLGYPDGVAVARWRPHWTDEDLDSGVTRDASPLIDDVDAHHSWSRAAARFAVVLGLLLDAEGAPFRIDVERPGKRRPGGARPAPQEWTTRHVYLDELAYSGTELRLARGEAGEASAAGDRLPEEVVVRGHLKRQRYGAGRARVRWIYVASYEARRWVAPRPVRVVVSRDRSDR
jgi:hypothetical protein